jgi:hypothetical protein
MSLKTYVPKCGRSSTFQKVQCKIQGSECPENTKEKIKLIITEQEKGWFMELAGIITSKLAYTF